jgi:hypothetical protein
MELEGNTNKTSTIPAKKKPDKFLSSVSLNDKVEF